MARQFHKYLRAHFDLPAEIRVFNKPGPLQIKAGPRSRIHRGLDLTP